MPGGIESGFKEVVKDTTKKLFQVKGKRYPRVFSVPLVQESINEGDVYILDIPVEGEENDDKLYFWVGKDCNVTEKMKGIEIA